MSSILAAAHSRALFALSIALFLFDCRSARRSPTERGASAPVAVPTASAVRPEDPAPRSINCGDAACRVGKERCCDVGETLRCTAEKPGFAQQEFEASVCRPATAQEPSSGRVLLCDDSGDCASRQRCCMTDEGMPDWYAARCVPGVGDCTHGELCSDEGGCRPPHRCVDGRCLTPAAERRVSCGKLTCSGATPVCCVPRDEESAPKCSTSGDCRAEGGNPYECTGAADCGALQFCMELYWGSRCFGSYPNGGLRGLCRTKADCKPWMWNDQPKPGVRIDCVAHDEKSWLKRCVQIE